MSSSPPWAYVVIYSGDISREEFVKALDKLPAVLNWYSILPNTVFVVSNDMAKAISDQIRDAIPVRHLLVLDAETDRNGWMPRAAWNFLRNPEPYTSPLKK